MRVRSASMPPVLGTRPSRGLRRSLSLIRLDDVENGEVRVNGHATRLGRRPSFGKCGRASSTEFPVIYVEGNIGSGKTTVLELLKKDPRLFVQEEPVDAWRKVRGGEAGCGTSAK